MPDNFQVIAVAHSAEKMQMSPAELSRFMNISLDEDFSRGNLGQIVSDTIRTKFANQEMAAYAPLIADYAWQIHKFYKQQWRDGQYPHNRLGIADVKRFLGRLNEVSAAWGKPAKEQVDFAVQEEGYCLLGIGLRDAYRAKLGKGAYKEPRFVQKGKQVFLEMGGVLVPTQHASLA